MPVKADIEQHVPVMGGQFLQPVGAAENDAQVFRMLDQVPQEREDRRVQRAAVASGSTAVRADAWHHRSDAITSLAAFIGISIALIGGPGWEQADDWAALLAACVIVYNGVQVMRPALQELMDRAPGAPLLTRVERAAHSVTGVLATEKLKMRRAGTAYYVDLHVQADPTLSLHQAHILSGMVKSAIRSAVPEVSGVLIHMEPYEDVKTGREDVRT